MLACGSSGWMTGFEHMEMGQSIGKEKQQGMKTPSEHKALLTVLVDAGIQGKILVSKWPQSRQG